MTGAAAELPIANSNLTPGQGLGRIASQSANLAPGAMPHTSIGASGAIDPKGIQPTGSETFLSNWQAMMASLDGSTGGMSIGTSSELGVADLAGQATNSSLGKGSAAASTAGSSAASAATSQAPSAPSADKLVRTQQSGELKAGRIFSSEGRSKSASPAVSGGTNASQSSRPTRSPGSTDSSNSVSSNLDPLPASILTASLSAANSSRTSVAAPHQNDPASPVGTNTSREPPSALATGSLASSGASGRSRPPATSDTQADASSARPDSETNVPALLAHVLPTTPAAGENDADAASNALKRLAVANGISESGTPSISVDPLSSVEASAAASAPSAGRRAGSGSKTESDSPAHQTERSQQVSGVGSTTILAVHGPEHSQGNLVPSTIGPGTGPPAAAGATPGAGSGSSSLSASGLHSSSASLIAHDTFAALDGDAPAGSFSWTHAGANRAEAGFEDPALGWVGVRADLGGGGVHASLVPGSAEAAQMLGSHLAGLNDYLAERYPAVGVVTVAGHENSGTLTNAHSGSGGESGPQSGPQSFTQQDSSSNSNANSSNDDWTLAGPRAASSAGERTVQSLPSNGVSPVGSSGAETMGRSSGSYISVMA